MRFYLKSKTAFNLRLASVALFYFSSKVFSKKYDQGNQNRQYQNRTQKDNYHNRQYEKRHCKSSVTEQIRSGGIAGKKRLAGRKSRAGSRFHRVVRRPHRHDFFSFWIFYHFTPRKAICQSAVFTEFSAKTKEFWYFCIKMHLYGADLQKVLIHQGPKAGQRTKRTAPTAIGTVLF